MKLKQMISLGFINFNQPLNMEPPNPGDVHVGGGDPNNPASLLNRNSEGDKVQTTAGTTDDSASASGNEPPDNGPPANKYAGKTPEELIALLEGNDQQMQELFGKASKADELEELLMNMLANSSQTIQHRQQEQQNPQQPTPLFTEEEAMEFFKNPQGALEIFANRIMERATKQAEDNISNRESMAQEHKQIRDGFYAANPDLVGAEVLVGAVGEAVQRANPNVPHYNLLPLIAKVSREEITKLRGVQNPVNPNLSGDPNLGGNPRVPATSPAEGQQAEINDLVNSRR